MPHCCETSTSDSSSSRRQSREQQAGSNPRARSAPHPERRISRSYAAFVIGAQVLFAGVLLGIAAGIAGRRWLAAYVERYGKRPARDWMVRVDADPPIERLRRIRVGLAIPAIALLVIGLVLTVADR
jgi:hypothetical protein